MRIFLVVFFFAPFFVNAANLPSIRTSLSTIAACDAELEGPVTSEEWDALVAKNPELGETFKSLKTILKAHPLLASKIDLSFVQAILLDPEMNFFHSRLALLTSRIKPSHSSRAGYQKLFARLLKNEVPASSIDKRISDFFDANWYQDRNKSFRRLLGENSLEEVQELVYGQDPFHPSEESLIGKYLAESGAAKTVRRFRTSANNKGPFDGLQRLVVSVDAKTWRIYKKYFTKINFLVHNHTPGQGTLSIANNGFAGSYGRLDNTFEMSQEGTIMPHLLLSTTEGQRLQLYSKLAVKNSSKSNYPWLRSGYCKMGGYNSCTFWVGNLPLGDEFVEELKFAGKVDSHAYNNVPRGAQIGETTESWIKNVQETRPETRTNGQLSYVIPSPVGSTTYSPDELDLVRRIWRTPSRMQLSELLGADELRANLRGEYANPGWVAIRLTAHVPTERMPVIFVITEDASKKLSPNFNPQISAY